jgi:hypothetical protein
MTCAFVSLAPSTATTMRKYAIITKTLSVPEFQLGTAGLPISSAFVAASIQSLPWVHWHFV